MAAYWNVILAQWEPQFLGPKCFYFAVVCFLIDPLVILSSIYAHSPLAQKSSIESVLHVLNTSSQQRFWQFLFLNTLTSSYERIKWWQQKISEPKKPTLPLPMSLEKVSSSREWKRKVQYIYRSNMSKIRDSRLDGSLDPRYHHFGFYRSSISLMHSFVRREIRLLWLLVSSPFQLLQKKEQWVGGWVSEWEVVGYRRLPTGQTANTELSLCLPPRQ